MDTKKSAWIFTFLIMISLVSATTITDSDARYIGHTYTDVVLIEGSYNVTFDEVVFTGGLVINASSVNISILNTDFNFTTIELAGNSNYFNNNWFLNATFKNTGLNNSCVNGTYWNISYSGDKGCAPPNITTVHALSEHRTGGEANVVYIRNINNTVKIQINTTDQTNISSGWFWGDGSDGVNFNNSAEYVSSSILRGNKTTVNIPGFHNITQAFSIDMENNMLYKTFFNTFQLKHDNTTPSISIIYPLNNSEINYIEGDTILTSVSINITTDDNSECRFVNNESEFTNFASGTLFTGILNNTKHNYTFDITARAYFNIRIICNNTVGLHNISYIRFFAWGETEPAPTFDGGGYPSDFEPEPEPEANVTEEEVPAESTDLLAITSEAISDIKMPKEVQEVLDKAKQIVEEQTAIAFFIMILVPIAVLIAYVYYLKPVFIRKKKRGG